MAISANCFDGTNAAVAAPGTSVAPALAVPDNCASIVVYNPDAANTIYMSVVVTAGNPIPAASGVHIPPNSSFTVTVGTLSQRPGTLTNLTFDASGGTPTARITYVNELGG